MDVVYGNVTGDHCRTIDQAIFPAIPAVLKQPDGEKPAVPRSMLRDALRTVTQQWAQ
ncbi:protein of unknown function [Kyrpidia spormannii]|uniref:Uncharacterized protein n=1 Tax=Kyrpidia spormannii TaxID=2055160 RepID=A0A6F9EHS9_9BACL|nr:protein of unknown function [Kyrpidia spormannii]